MERGGRGGEEDRVNISISSVYTYIFDTTSAHSTVHTMYIPGQKQDCLSSWWHLYVVCWVRLVQRPQNGPGLLCFLVWERADRRQ